MPAGDFERVFAALEARGVRYLVVGGVAVVLHGHPRFTADLDLVLALDPQNLASAIAALEGLGLRPRAPVRLADFANADGGTKTLAEIIGPKSQSVLDTLNRLSQENVDGGAASYETDYQKAGLDVAHAEAQLALGRSQLAGWLK